MGLGRGTQDALFSVAGSDCGASAIANGCCCARGRGTRARRSATGCPARRRSGRMTRCTPSTSRSGRRRRPLRNCSTTISGAAPAVTAEVRGRGTVSRARRTRGRKSFPSFSTLQTTLGFLFISGDLRTPQLDYGFMRGHKHDTLSLITLAVIHHGCSQEADVESRTGVAVD